MTKPVPTFRPIASPLDDVPDDALDQLVDKLAVPTLTRPEVRPAPIAAAAAPPAPAPVSDAGAGRESKPPPAPSPLPGPETEAPQIGQSLGRLAGISTTGPCGSALPKNERRCGIW